jgi:hypothetical protein
MSTDSLETSAKSFTRNWFPKFLTEEDCKTMTDEELLSELKKSPDFDKLVFPTTWHQKFPDLPKADCLDTKGFLKESPWLKKHTHYYGDGGRIVDVEAKPGGVRPVLATPDVPSLTVLQNSFSDAPRGQSENEHPEHSPEASANSTGSNDSKSPA